MNLWMQAFLVVLVTSVGSLAAVGALIGYAIRRGVLDHPTERSSHVRPTPRGGGAGLLAIFGIAFLVLTHRNPWGYGWEIFTLLGIALVAAIGFIDDHRSVGPWIRLAVHGLGGLCIALAAKSTGAFSLPWLGAWLFLTIASVNVVNFMDGIDGIIATQSIVFGIGLCLLNLNNSTVLLPAAAFTGASLGFLRWNWSPASIFLGDVGSGGIGAVLICFGVMSVRTFPELVLTYLPLVPLIVDAGYTLVLRCLRGERLTEAHRTHLYQQLAARGISHMVVSTVYALVSCIGVCISVIGWRIDVGLWIGGVYLLAVLTVRIVLEGQGAQCAA